MALKTISENPTISDTVLLALLTPDADGCFSQDPYKVKRITIYYLKRSFTDANYGETQEIQYDPILLAEYSDAKAAACASPTVSNLSNLQQIQTELDLSKKIDTIYFKEALAVHALGNDDYPAWIGTDEENAFIEHVTEDDFGNTIYGRFTYEWNPVGQREGHYIVMWEWMPTSSSGVLANSEFFYLKSDLQVTTSIPTHLTKENKYEILFDRYTNEVFKTHMLSDDLTPEIISEVNNAFAGLFTDVENLSNQEIDLLDANVVNESFLELLGNTFNLKFRSNDPTLWRRQIKRAIPLFKKKGTYSGLEEAFAQAGMKLKKYTPLWQIISKYTWQEYFVYDDSLDFTLKYEAILPIDTDHFELYIRKTTETTWTTLTSDYVDFSTTDGVTTMSWIGDTLMVDPITLEEGDEIRVVYQKTIIPTVQENSLEVYIRSLSLADLRDPRDQTYPPINWNIRVIEDDDPLFDSIIQTKHPYQEETIFGFIRTEFPYGENVYNMEEYNGSTRESTDPCDVDKNFTETCNYCLSSLFNLDLEIEDLSDDRLLESQEIIREFVPFHASLHSLNLIGVHEDILLPPVEEITSIARFYGEEHLIHAQTVFNRNMALTSQYLRDELADVESAFTGTGDLYNDDIVLYCSNVNLGGIPLNEEFPNSTFLEIFSPSVNAGEYTVENQQLNRLSVVGSFSEPLDSTDFSFRISNEVIRKVSAEVRQKNKNVFYNGDDNFEFLDIVSQWDVENSDKTGVWKVDIDGYGVYPIMHILPDGGLLLHDLDNSLPVITTDDLTFSILDSDDVEQYNNTVGFLEVFQRGLVDFSGGTVIINGSSTAIENIRNFVEIGDYALIDGSQYKILALQDDFKTTSITSSGTTATVTRVGHGLNTGDIISISGVEPEEYIMSQVSVVKIDDNTFTYTTDNSDIEDATTQGFVSANYQFIINDYSDGGASGVEIVVYHRLVDEDAGSLHYEGLTLVGSENHEVNLGILNGVNAPTDPNDILENDLYKENFLVIIDDEVYTIAEIDGATLYLIGPPMEATTAGSSVSYEILKIKKFKSTSIDPPLNMRFDPRIDVAERIYPPMPDGKIEFYDRNAAYGEIIYTSEDQVASLGMEEAVDKIPQDILSQSEIISFKFTEEEENIP